MTDAEPMDINLHLLDIKSGDFDTYKKNHEPAAAAHPGVLVLSMKFDTARPRKPTRDNDFSARVSAQRRADATR